MKQLEAEENKMLNKETKGYHLIDFKEIIDERGHLLALESFKNVPFEIKRMYCIYNNTSQLPRGAHAHKKLQQLMFVISGNCKVKVDNGRFSEVIHLKNASQGLLLSDVIWREMYDFSKDCVLSVLASDYYKESDYIRDKDEFLEYVTLLE